MKCRPAVFQYVLALFLTVVHASQFCGNCPSGYFVSGCKTNTTANCEPCPQDTFKLGNNAVKQCTRCSFCIGRNNIEIQTCNGTHDRKCRCKDGFWYDTGALFCSKCSSCKRGKGVVEVCSLTADTKCQRCVRGVTFSPENSKSEPCIPCKKCSENEELVRICTRRKDTECKAIPLKNQFQSKNKSKWPDKLHGNNSTTEPSTKLSEHPTSTVRTKPTGKTEITGTTSVSLGAATQDKTSVNYVMIILYVVGPLLAIALVVLVICFVKHRRNIHINNSKTQIAAPCPTSCKIEEPTNKLSTPLMSGSTDKLLRNVSYSLIDDLQRNLNPKGRWKTLAGKLGFSSKDIENFEITPTTATETMLSQWGQQKGSTLHNLYHVLKGLKWFVEAEMVTKYW